MDGTDIVLRLVGIFYVLGGYVGSRVALTSHFLDRALAAISAGQPKPAETAQTVWLLASSVLILAGGVALVLLLDVASWLFLASAIGQALYLTWLAPKYFDRDDPPDDRGRRQTTNAFIVYTAATALVLWAAHAEKLLPWQDVPGPVLATGVAAVAVHAGYVLWSSIRPLSRPGMSSTASSDLDVSEAPFDPSQVKRVQVMAERDAHPLWALDEGVSGDFPPEALALSPELVRDLNAWAQQYSSAFSRTDPPTSLWTEAQHRAHEEAMQRLAVRLKRERPDLIICVLDPVGAFVEIHEGDQE